MGAIASFSWTFLAKVAHLVLNLAVGAVLYRAIGAEGKGTLDALVTWAALLLLFSPPLEDPQIALLGQDRTRARALFSNALALSLLTGIFVWFVFEVLILTAPGWLTYPDQAGGPRLSLDTGALWWLVLVSPCAVLQRLCGSLLQGLRDLRAFNLIQLVPVTTVFGLVMVLVVAMGGGWREALLAHVIAHAVGGALAVIACLAHPEIGRTMVRPDRGLMSSVFVRGLKLHGGVLAAWAITESDKLLLNHARGPAELGIYGLAVQLTGHLRRLFAAPAKDVFVSRMADWLTRREAFEDALARATRHTIVLVGVPGLLLAAAGPLVIRVLGGPDLAAAYTPLLILIPGSVCWAAAAMLGYWMIGTERFLLLTATGIVVACFNLALNLVLIPRFGYLAAAYSSTASYALHLALFLIILARGTGRGPLYWLKLSREDLRALIDVYAKIARRFSRRRDPNGGR